MEKNEASVKVTGWLNDVKSFDWGTALKVAVDVRKQNGQGEWETVDKTIYDVTTGDKVALDGVKQVTVTGRIVGTATFQKRDGSTGSAVRVRANMIQATEAPTASVSQMQELWPTVKQIPDENAPF
jgi:hypothetical protein